MKTDIVSRLYELFDPVSNSSPQFRKKIVFVSDSDILAAPVTLVKARRILGIRCERVAGRPAWHAPTISLNMALRHGFKSAAAALEQKKKKADRGAQRLLPELREFMVEQGLAVPYYDAMRLFKEWRIAKQFGRGFSYTAFSGAVRELGLDCAWYNNLKYYYQPSEDLNDFVDSLFDKSRQVKEEVILARGKEEGYHPAAIMQVRGFERMNKVWRILS